MDRVIDDLDVCSDVSRLQEAEEGTERVQQACTFASVQDDST